VLASASRRFDGFEWREKSMSGKHVISFGGEIAIKSNDLLAVDATE